MTVHQRLQIHLQRVPMNHRHPRAIDEQLPEDGNQPAVDFHGQHPSRPIRQPLRQRPHPRSDLQHTGGAIQFRGVDDPVQHPFIHQKVLPQALFEGEVVIGQQFAGP